MLSYSTSAPSIGSPSPASTDTKWHLGTLDALRGIAVLGVVLVHSLCWSSIHILNSGSRTLNGIAFSGQRGVQLFFVVSAFTLFLSDANRRSEKNPVLNFFLRRLFRLTPMLWVAGVLTWAVFPEVLGSPTRVALHFVYLAGFWSKAIDAGPIGSWSIATEACFYMALPLLFRWIRTPYQALSSLIGGTLLVFALTPHLIGLTGNVDFWCFKSIFANCPVFLLGTALYFIWRHTIAPNRLSNQDARLLSASLLTVAAVLYLYDLPFPYENNIGQSAIFAFLVPAVLLHPWAALINRATIALGKLSFSMYLLHFYVAHFIEKALLALATHHTWAAGGFFQFAATFAATVCLTVPIALVTYTLIETPGIRLGRRLIAYLEDRRLSRRNDSDLRGALDRRDARDAQF